MPTSIALLLSLLSSMTMAVVMSMDPAEKETLLRIMEAISSDRDWRSASSDPCSAPWPGLECKPAAAPGTENATSVAAPCLHVTRLDFGVAPNPTCKDSATFPSHVFDLPHLQSLFLVDCFKSPRATTTLDIPFSNLSSSRLQQLSIRSNPSLSGTMPPELASLKSLQVLTISQNGLIRGEIPQRIGELKNLVHLDLSYNSLTGAIPSQIGQLRSLVGLDLSYNSFSGPIPSRIGELAQLQKLDLSSNNLTGGIPDTITGLDSLTFLALSNNRLSEGFPTGISGLRNLQYLIMDNNPMYVPLPSELGNIARLQELRLANSGYSGSIPETFGLLASLTSLSLESNNLTGKIPAGLSRLKRMYHLNLSKNGLDGVVPFDGTFLRRLGRNLDLSGNPGLCVNDQIVVVSDVGVGVCRAGVADSSDVNSSVGRVAKGRIMRGFSNGLWSGLLLRPASASVVLCCFLL